MRPERWGEVKRLLAEALEQDPEVRETWLNAHCRDEELFSEVQSLLREQNNKALLEIPDTTRVSSFLREHRAESAIGRQIGKFKVRAVLGYGGMGVVYRAEQDHPKREVALKIIPAGPHASPYQLKLFRREVQSMARMQHPGIAALYEAGSAEDGQHYFAMELVDGSPLLDYANERRLAIRERLELFTRVCEAIHYAHQKGVIHRDIKPNNVLVGLDEQPKLLDFGLAKLMEDDGATVSAALGKVHGTLSYMSPEQAGGSSSDIDVRSDVYSLGVVLYELLTHRRPFDLAQRNVPQAIDIICKEMPPSVGTIIPTLRGDVETIVAKAMEKEPLRRYQSAHALAEDIERFLTQQPISARPASAIYQFRKFARRHKLPVALATLLFLVVNGSAILAITLSIRLARQRDQAVAAMQSEVEARQMFDDSTNGFLAVLFEQSLQGLEERQDITVRELLGRLDRGLNSLRDQPELQAPLLETMARGYLALGAPKEAKEHAAAALALYRNLPSADEPKLVRSLHDLGWRFHEQHEYEAAEPLFREGLEIRRRTLGEDHILVLASQVCLAEMLGHLKRFEEADDLLSRSFRTYASLGMAESRHCGFAHIVKGGVLMNSDRPEEAESAFRRAAEILDKFGPSDGQRLLASRELGLALVTLRKFAEAESVLRPVLESYVSLLPGHHYSIPWTRMLLGRCKSGLGEFAEAEALLLRAYDDVNRLSKRGRGCAAKAQEALIDLYDRWGRGEDASKWREKTDSATAKLVQE